MALKTHPRPPQLYAIIELFDQDQVAGKVTDYRLGNHFIRIDIPVTATHSSYTRIINPWLVSAIKPVTKEQAQMVAEDYPAQPFEAWDSRNFELRLPARQPPVAECHQG